MQFPSIFGDVKYVILIGGLHIEDKAHFICGSGWGVGLRLGCSPLAELYRRWMTTILSALGMIITFHWWHFISISKEHTYSHRVIQTYLKNDLTSSRGRDVCVSTAHLLSKWKL